MNPSTLKPSHTHPSLLLPAPSPLRTQRRRFRVSLPRCSSDTNNPASSSSPPQRPPKELNGIEILVDKLSSPARLATSAVIVAGAVAAGYGLGSRFGGSRNAALGGAVALGAAGGAAAYALNAAAPQVAAVNLHNYVAGFDDPSILTREDIEVIANKYGVSKQDEAFKAEICDIYSEFVSSVIPPGGEELKGDEVDKIVNFKSSLGLDDPDAAAVHMEIGRKLFRQRLEVGDREGGVEQRRAFQKLIYVSNIVFGDASSFLLPWKRVFKVTESQVEVAIRDNAQRLYASKLKSVGRDFDLGKLVTLKETQSLCCLSDELAENLFREHARKLVEENISVALGILKSRTRAVPGVSQVVEEIEKVLAFNDLLISFKNHSDIDRLARGVGPVSLVGGEYDADRKIEDLKLLYRAYVSDALSSGRMEDNKFAALNQLKNIFGLGKREAEAILLDITRKVYRKRLGQTVSSGELEMADSKAAFLQNLCDELHFDPQKASELHEEIYRQKLQQCVADGELTDENVAALLKLRVMLCVPQQTVEAAHAEICGNLFEKIVKDAIASGVDGYDDETKKSVRKAAHGLRLTKETALSIASKAVRKMFITYVKRSRSAKGNGESAKELKKLIAFNTLVVTKLVEDIKGESPDVKIEEPKIEEPEEIRESEEYEMRITSDTQENKTGQRACRKDGKAWSDRITLKDDLPEKDRADLYKTFLTYCLTGDVVRIPFGVEIKKKKDDTEYIYLNQLGGILGLTGKVIMDVHRGLAEQAFRKQAEVLLADGQLTKARVEQLGKMQKEIGLSQEYAQKIIKNITTTKMAAAIETAVTQGKLNMKQIRELKESNVDLDSMVSVSLRETIFKKTVGDIFSSGTGEFDEEEVYEKIPLDLNINKEKARGVVCELAQNRLSNSLIQAVALLRQRNHKGVVFSLNNLLACDKAVPSQTLSWEVSEELSDLYTIYLKSDPSPEKLSRLQYLLGINDSTAAALRDSEDSLLETAEEEKFVF
uniref:Protein TIC110, chloroplastic n=1 Tax=Pisum sativum TaxID=3888 RepID=TI110_PEA|nr:RecName: Full=Protein TIC110, chloroplastic; AltName: Full=Chloroplast inner envelope protein, 110 kDa; Short=psIEP110; AltName: Full=IAP100; AltName: Full=Translocon at the inner envelope membrane of chloroplasts 110; Flags: Precursor [Pisum sativum]AAC49399.1 IAP100 [Pisum sativum]